MNHKQLKLIAVAKDEVEALDLITNKKPDAVVIDTGIPSLNWFDIIENKSLENGPIFVLVSGEDGAERKALVLENGKYEIKSFDINDLLDIAGVKITKLYKKENVVSMLNNVGINSTMKGHQYLVAM